MNKYWINNNLYTVVNGLVSWLGTLKEYDRKICDRKIQRDYVDGPDGIGSDCGDNLWVILKN